MKTGKKIIACMILTINAQLNFAQQPDFVCMIKIDNSRYDGVSKIEMVKGKTYHFYMSGKHTNYINTIKSSDPGVLIKKTGSFGLTLSECGTYIQFEISITSTAAENKNLKISFSGNVPITNEQVACNLTAAIIEKPVIKRVIFMEGSSSVVQPISGIQYNMKASGTNLTYLQLMNKPGVSFTSDRYSDTSINCKIIFDYSQQKTFTGLAGLVLPLYGSNGPGLYDKEEIISVPAFVVLPRQTVFDVNNIDWAWGPFYGERGTFFADVTGDGKADAIAINNSNVFVRRSNGTEFQPNESWTANPYYGERGTFFKDVTGDGKADAIVVNNSNIVVRRSNGTRFSDNENWTSNACYGERGTFFADVTGDGKADAIVVSNANIVVRPSIGNSFGEQQIWTTGAFYGERSTEFADVDGDGKADVIAVNNYGIVIKKSVGNRFGPNETFTTNPYYGTRGTFFVDITGDSKADAIVINDDKITVRRSTGTAFSPNEDGTNQAFYGQRGTAFADIHGDGKAAVIVINNETVYARKAK